MRSHASHQNNRAKNMITLASQIRKTHQRDGSSFPQVEHYYQSPTLRGGCGTPAKFRRPSFFEISNDYFAGEAARGFVEDAAIFGALILTTVLPIVSSIQAIAALIRSINVF